MAICKISDSCPLWKGEQKRYRRILNSSPEGFGHGQRKVQEMPPRGRRRRLLQLVRRGHHGQGPQPRSRRPSEEVPPDRSRPGHRVPPLNSASSGNSAYQVLRSCLTSTVGKPRTHQAVQTHSCFSGLNSEGAMRFWGDTDHKLPAVRTIRHWLRYSLIVGLHIRDTLGHQFANTGESFFLAGRKPT